ncbi:MAG: two-component system response regulator OmpR [Desulfobacterium sp.]|nr:two-component system response regulator OmpR [Desulfobacterium sp.]
MKKVTLLKEKGKSVKTKILVVDDDVKLQQLLTEYLQGYGYKTISLLSGTDVIKTIQQEEPHIIILDIVLPDRDGFEILKDIRQTYSIPVIMLSAKGEETDRIVGLEMGADDYMPKPYNPRELMARIKAVLRRAPSKKYHEALHKELSDCIHAYGLTLDRSKQILIKGEKNTELTSTEYKIIEAMMKRPNIVFSRDVLMNRARGDDAASFDRSIDMHISKLRAKIESVSGSRRQIKTVWSSGYKLVDA